MGRTKILKEDQSYSFRSYFEMCYEADEILAEFGYGLSNERLSLPKTAEQLPNTLTLQQQIEDYLPLVRLSSETARRETLVAPILLEVARFSRCQLRIEYPLMVNNWLKGNLDYLLHKDKSCLVVEAKNDDLTRGFTQLAIEMIALSQLEEQSLLYGAVTIGDVWRFGRLDQSQQLITQDITLYRVPDDLPVLLSILVGIVMG